MSWSLVARFTCSRCGYLFLDGIARPGTGWLYWLSDRLTIYMFTHKCPKESQPCKSQLYTGGETLDCVKAEGHVGDHYYGEPMP